MKVLIHSLVFLIALLQVMVAWAEDSVPALSMGTFRQLTVVERLLSEQQFTEAQDQLNKMMADVSDLSNTDQAYTYHMQALLYLHQEQYSQAKQYFLNSYQQQALTAKTRIQVLEMLANLAMHEENYRQAIRFSKEYLSASDNPTKSGYLILASAYYQIQEYANAIDPLKQVIARFKPDRSAYSTLFAVYYELKKLAEATSLVEKMIRIWPEKSEYWLQLASIYLEQDKLEKSLEIMQLAYTQNFLIRENDLLHFVYILYEKNLPNKAVQVLDEALQKLKVKPGYKSYQLLAQLYMEAREEYKSLKAYLKTSELSETGREYLYVAQIYYDQEDYPKTIQHAKKALEKGIKLPGNAYMLIAAAYQEMSRPKEAKANLTKAVEYKETMVSASQWLKNLE